MNTNPAIINDPSRAGALAASKELFGRCSRYAIAPVHSRFDEVRWFVWDAELPDAHGLASIIRNTETRAEALRGLFS